MSEINSIANGTFTIGETSATNFIAGPGITIDSPSAGTVRIGNDETVLWSGTCTSGNTANLSESVKNFEKIEFYGHENNRGRSCLYSYRPLSTYNNNTLTFCVSMPDYSDDSTWCAWYFSNLKWTDTNASAFSHKGGDQAWWQTTANGSINNVTARFIIIDKIIGINRKQNGGN